jgi:hypothetical protein
MTIDLSDVPQVRGPAVATPARRPGSVRRTSTIDTTWPAGWGELSHLVGRARDLLTPVDPAADPIVLAEDAVRATATRDRVIDSVAAQPPRPHLNEIVGSRGGGKLRGVLERVIPDELAAGTPLYLLLDDFAGATLVAGFAFSQWPDLWPAEWTTTDGVRLSGRRMEGICAGFSPGASSLNPDGTSRHTHDIRSVTTVAAADDPDGWHDFTDTAAISHRRSRRIDIWIDDVIRIDSFFQDSFTVPTGGRIAVHEYVVTATADPQTYELLSVDADPRILPYRECPLATRNVGRMIGTPLPALRHRVLDELKTTAGCTHLNDALRALAEVPILLGALGHRMPTPAPVA